MRIFIGIPASDDLKEKVIRWREPYARLPDRRTGLPVRWAEPHNLHVTLVPPWYEDDPQAVVDRLSALRGEIAPFDITFRHASFGPTLKEPRLIWATGRASEELYALRHRLEELFPDRMNGSRGLLLHMTVARFHPSAMFNYFKPTSAKGALSDPEQSEGSRRASPLPQFPRLEGWRMAVREIAVFESALLRGGAEYRIVGKQELMYH